MPSSQIASKQNHLIPISNGIIEHREKIGSAVWLFILLIDWTTTAEENGAGKVLGGKPIKVKDLIEVLHLHERQIRSDLQRLKAGGYIRLTRNPYGYSIEVTKSKKFINRDRQKLADLSSLRPAENYRSRPAETCRSGIETGTKPPVQTGNFLPEQRRHYRRDITNKREIAESVKPILGHSLFTNGDEEGTVAKQLAPDSGKKQRRSCTALGILPELQPIVSRVVARINELSGKAYRDDKPDPLKPLLDRLKAGATEAECLAIVEDKWLDWGRSEQMFRRFNPATLFRRGKFEEYLTEARAVNARNNGRRFKEEKKHEPLTY